MALTEREITLDFVRGVLKEGKPINEIMQDIMRIGKKITDEVGHKDYNSFEEFLEEIEKGTSPLQLLDQEIEVDVDDSGLNVIAVKKCALADLMEKMKLSDDTHDHLVFSSLDGFQVREGEGQKFIDLGCYIMQQLRQMLISSITIRGEPILNYIHLACQRGGHEVVYCEGDVKDINMSKTVLDDILKDHHCVYAIYSTKEE